MVRRQHHATGEAVAVDVCGETGQRPAVRRGDTLGVTLDSRVTHWTLLYVYGSARITTRRLRYSGALSYVS